MQCYTVYLLYMIECIYTRIIYIYTLYSFSPFPPSTTTESNYWCRTSLKGPVIINYFQREKWSFLGWEHIVYEYFQTTIGCQKIDGFSILPQHLPNTNKN